jgi:hypothetical protein
MSKIAFIVLRSQAPETGEVGNAALEHALREMLLEKMRGEWLPQRWLIEKITVLDSME